MLCGRREGKKGEGRRVRLVAGRRGDVKANWRVYGSGVLQSWRDVKKDRGGKAGVD